MEHRNHNKSEGPSELQLKGPQNSLIQKLNQNNNLQQKLEAYHKSQQKLSSRQKPRSLNKLFSFQQQQSESKRDLRTKSTQNTFSDSRISKVIGKNQVSYVDSNYTDIIKPLRVYSIDSERESISNLKQQALGFYYGKSNNI